MHGQPCLRGSKSQGHLTKGPTYKGSHKAPGFDPQLASVFFQLGLHLAPSVGSGGSEVEAGSKVDVPDLHADLLRSLK